MKIHQELYEYYTIPCSSCKNLSIESIRLMDSSTNVRCICKYYDEYQESGCIDINDYKLVWTTYIYVLDKLVDRMDAINCKNYNSSPYLKDIPVRQFLIYNAYKYQNMFLTGVLI